MTLSISQKFILLCFVLNTSLIGYFLFWPVPVDPAPWTAPASKGFNAEYQTNTKMQNLKHISLNPSFGPEDAVLMTTGDSPKILVGTDNGTIFKIDLQSQEKSVFAITGGRPFGLEMDAKGYLYVADGKKGLLRIDPTGQIETLATHAQDGSLIGFADDLAVTEDGTVYLSDASQRFPAHEFGVYEGPLLEILEHRASGRILKYDPKTKSTTVFIDQLSFPNGLALAPDESYLLFCETATYSVKKHILRGANQGQTLTIKQDLPGFPDNINRAQDGNYWLGIVSPRAPIIDQFSNFPLLRKMIQRLPQSMRPKPTRYGFLAKISPEGHIIETWQDPKGDYAMVTGAIDDGNGKVIVTSLKSPTLGVMELSY